MHQVYLDYNATTPLRSEVRAAMEACMTTDFGNPSSLHWAGRRAKESLETARDKVASLVRARASQIVFTSGGTESNNLALRGLIERDIHGPYQIVTTPIEHSSILQALRAQQRQTNSLEVVFLPVDKEGRVKPSDVESMVSNDTALVSIGLANQEIGTIQPIRKIARFLNNRGIPLHVDAVQAAGKIPLNVQELGVDALSLSAHKLYGPKGIGALYVRKETMLQPVFFGGPQEREKRPGTENVVAAVGFGFAAEHASQDIEKYNSQMIHLVSRLWQGIEERIPNVTRYTPVRACLPNTLNVGFNGTSGEGLMMALDLEGVAVSTGSACASGSVEPSHVLQALGAESSEARSALRFSAGTQTTQGEIETVLNILPKVVDRVRSTAREVV